MMVMQMRFFFTIIEAHCLTHRAQINGAPSSLREVA